MPASYTGKLLVATPKLTDPNFARTVILMIAHDDNGALGVVLNRPITQAPLADHVPAWAGLAAPPGVVFLGGPVEPVRALGIGRIGGGAECPGWTRLDGQTGLVDLTREPADIDVAVREVRVFTGYAGWSAGQLDGEVQEDAWFVISAEPEDAFTADPATLWTTVLRRQSGKLAMFAHFPVIPPRISDVSSTGVP